MTANSGLRRLIYVSHAVGEVNASVLDGILATARNFNVGRQVTGLLLFHEGTFFQVLEGETQTLRTLMVKIGKDARHDGLLTLADGPIAVRTFPNWSMGFIETTALTPGQRAGFFDLLAFTEGRGGLPRYQDTIVQTLVHSFLSTFREFEAA